MSERESEVELQPLTLAPRHRDGDGYNDDNDDNDRDSAGAQKLTCFDGVKPETATEILVPARPDTWRARLDDWLYPPHLPRSCQLLRCENIAVPMCYLLVGILQGLLGALTNVYPLDLGATEAQQTTISNIRSLPASFKLLFGFLSDNVPIAGFRRKSYMLIGWAVAALSMSSVILKSDLTLVPHRVRFNKTDGALIDHTYTYYNRTYEAQELEDTTELKIDLTAAEGAPSVSFLSLALLLYGTGFWIADVMGDSVVAEKAKLEPAHARGSVQSSCYAYRFFGLMISAPLSTVIYSWSADGVKEAYAQSEESEMVSRGPYHVVTLLSLLPLTILPLVIMLYERTDIPIASTRSQCGEIWKTVCSRAVWQPLGFVFIYNVLQVPNAAWKQFLRTVLHFSDAQLNTLYILSCVLLYVGIITYKNFMMTWSWRSVYIITTTLGGILSLLQILLITGNTFGIDPFVFAFGDDAFADFIGGIQFLPTTIMMVHLCPAGSEGAAYAMFTTVNNSALNLNVAIATALLRIWEVGKETLASGRLQGLINLTLLTTGLQVSGILFVGWLPKTKEDLTELTTNGRFGTSRIGGFIFLFITFSSVLYSIVVGLLNIISPGWMGES